MCRTKELGGRRCPQHTNPVKHAAYNARRRELYAAKKTQTKEAKAEDQPLHSGAYKVSIDKLDQPRWFLTKEQYHIENKNSEEYEKLLNEQQLIRKQDNPLSPDLVSAVYDWTALSSPEIRDYLNGYDVGVFGMQKKQPIVYGEQRARYMQEKVDALDAALKVAPEPDEPRTVWRGIRLPVLQSQRPLSEWADEHFPVGEVISQKSFMSTTLDPALANTRFTSSDSEAPGIIMEIKTKKGAVIMTSALSEWADESEVLIPRDARFKVAKVTHNTRFYTRNLECEYSREDMPSMEELEQDSKNTKYLLKKNIILVQLVDADAEVEETDV